MPSGTRTVLVEQQTVTVAANIRAEMGRRQISQTALAEAIGISQPGVSKRLKGSVAWTLPELTKVAEVLETPLAALIDGVAA